MLLNATKYHGYKFYRFGVNKGKPPSQIRVKLIKIVCKENVDLFGLIGLEYFLLLLSSDFSHVVRYFALL